MSRPRFLADNDLNEQIVRGALRREPAMDFLKLRHVGLANRPDPEVLSYAATEGLILVTHDVNTMRGFALQRLSRREQIAGLFLVSQRAEIGPVIESLILVWCASEAEEWVDRIRFLPL